MTTEEATAITRIAVRVDGECYESACDLLRDLRAEFPDQPWELIARRVGPWDDLTLNKEVFLA